MFLKLEGGTFQRRQKAKYILRDNTGLFNDKIFREEMPLLIRTNNKQQKRNLAQGEDYFFLLSW